MDKYIKTEDLLDAIYPVDPENDGSDGCTVVAAPSTFTSEELEAMLDKIPAADVAPVIHARWVVKKIGYAKSIAFCSACGGQACTNSRTFHEQGADIIGYRPIITKYCKDCGAKMDKED